MIRFLACYRSKGRQQTPDYEAESKLTDKIKVSEQEFRRKKRGGEQIDVWERKL